jgi:hypothetical protein
VSLPNQCGPPGPVLGSAEAHAAPPIVPSQIYSPIEEWQTRLLELTLHADEECLKYNLITVDMIRAEGVVIHGTTTRIHYEALSYSWGYHPPTHSVSCNGKLCFISEQLSTALRLLRKRGHRYVFVDCFCINQDDVAEKSIQVQGMFEIFAKANAVLVWLGDITTTKRICELSGQLATIDTHDVHEPAPEHEKARLSLELASHLAACPWFQRT